MAPEYDAQGFWNPDLIAEYRLNFSVLFGVMRQKLYQVLIGKTVHQKAFKPFLIEQVCALKLKFNQGDCIATIR